MFACSSAVVVKALCVIAGVLAGGIRVDMRSADSSPVVTIVARSAPDTVRAPAPPARPKAPNEPITITITDEGIQVGGEGTMKIHVDTEKLNDLTRKLDQELKGKLEGLPESIAVHLSEEYDAVRYVKVKGSDMVQFGSKISVDSNELVNGNVVSIAADIQIDGKVTGDVAAIFGSVHLGPHAIVNGEVVSIFGNIEREDGAVIRGETAVIGGGIPHRGIVYPIGAFGESVVGGVIKIATFVIGVLLMLILLFFMPGRMRAASEFESGSFLKSIGMGLLVFFGGSVLVAILVVVLAITIVGIPVAVLLGLSFAAMLGIGYAVSALALGSFAARKFGVENDSIYFQAVIGLFFLAIFGIAASFMSLSPLFGPARVALRTVGGIAQFAALLAGTGAFVLSRAGGTRVRGIPGGETTAAR